MFFTVAVIVLVFLVIFQIAKASEYVAVLKGEEKANRQNNKINAFLMIAFLIVGLIGVYWCNELLYGKTLFPQGSASEQGEKIDSMLRITILITGIVFFITQILLFWFAYKYQYKPNQRVYFFPHNNKLELIWTVVPAIALTVLIVIGLRNWFAITSAAPDNALQVEVTGKQFGWMFRYPGKDHIFGQKYYRVIDDENNNPLGQIWKDNAALHLKADPANFDDIFVTQTMYVIKGKPVKLIINSRDVIHDVGLAHFRMKMDAVPGIPTTMWFTPKYTTKEMRERTGNPNFQYEISCDQMCGNGHYSMKGVVEVVTQAEFDEWMAKQKPLYVTANTSNTSDQQQPATGGAAADTTTTKASAKVDLNNTKSKANG